MQPTEGGDAVRSVPANGRRPLRLLVALGRGLFRSGLCLLLRERWGVTVVEGEERPWDLALADLEGLGGASMEPLRRLRRSFPKRPVLVVSERPEEIFGRRALEAGAAGFVPTSCSPEELVGAIDRVAAGGRYVSQDLAERMLATRKAGPVDDLSFREFQVLLGVVAGLRGKELGYALDLSPKTVCTYRARVLAKLGLGSDAALVRFAVGAGLVEEAGVFTPVRSDRA